MMKLATQPRASNLSSACIHSSLQSQRWLVGCWSYGRSRDGFFSDASRKTRRSKIVAINEQPVAAAASQGTPAESVKLSVARTKILKGCKSASQMLAELQGFRSKSNTMINSIHLSIIFTRLPKLPASLQVKQQVVRDITPDLVQAIESEFPYPQTAQVTTQGLENVAWGIIQLKQAAKSDSDFLGVLGEFESQVLRLLDKHLEKCSSVELAVALDCFAKAKYPRLSPERITNLVRNKVPEASGQNTARYLYVLQTLGIKDSNLKLALGLRQVDIADEPQDCSNTILALARQGVDAEEIVQQLAAKVLSLTQRPKAQAVSNTFLALYERGWKLERGLAIQLLEELMDRFQHTDEVDAYATIQVLRGLEHHGVVSTDLDLRLLVTYLLEKCPSQFFGNLNEVASSLYSIGYPHQPQIAQLKKLYGKSSLRRAKR